MNAPAPDERPDTFRTTVHGTVFGARSAHATEVAVGEELLLIPDPPGDEEPAVWVHLHGGDPLGHLPPEISAWLAPWMLHGGRASAVVVKVGGLETPSWKRLVIEVRRG